MIKDKIKSNKGITLITLIFAIIIMIIIASTVIYNAHTGLTTRALNNMYNDVQTLKDRVDIYYAKYGKLPILTIGEQYAKYTNVDNFKTINKNDNNNYFVIDIEALDNLTLTYGKEFKNYKESQTAPEGDIYIINEKSHTIYYVAGIALDSEIYYTIPEEYTQIKSSTKCNPPKLATGMTPVKWNGTEFIDTTNYDNEWYDYIDTSIETQKSTSKWANARTEDGSMWVWIPRYAYKITYNDEGNKSLGGKIDIVFLKDNTNYDYRGLNVTREDYVNEDGTKGAYIVHPSFQDGRANAFSNGEWDEEITGFWMAKFEAGYAGNASDKTSATDSTVRYSVIYGYNGGTGRTEEITNTYYGTRQIDDNIKYPVFMANRPSMNYIGINDAYALSKSLTAENNPYGLNNINSHLTKNSEWGAVAYLTHSKYGRNGEEIRINNVSANGENTIFAVTGYGASTENASEDTVRRLADLTSSATEKHTGDWIDTGEQSSTGNIYGIYDLSGGLSEWTTGYITTTGNYESYGKNLPNYSNKYNTKYNHFENGNTQTLNYNENNNETIKRNGEAIWETSTSGTGTTSWNEDSSNFLNTTTPFSVRGGAWSDMSSAGVFSYNQSYGYCYNNIGFRVVLITE